MTQSAAPPRLTEIAARIEVHLKRFEADPAINAPKKQGGMRLPPYFWTRAMPAGRYVQVVYVSYQGATNLSREDALRYLAALDGGYVGKHWHIPESK